MRTVHRLRLFEYAHRGAGNTNRPRRRSGNRAASIDIGFSMFVATARRRFVQAGFFDDGDTLNHTCREAKGTFAPGSLLGTISQTNDWTRALGHVCKLDGVTRAG